MLAIRQI